MPWNNNNERHCRKTTIQAQTPPTNHLFMPLLQPGVSFLLALPVRLSYLSGMHGWKHMGDVLQCHHLAVPGLWGAKWVWESIKERFRVQGSRFKARTMTCCPWVRLWALRFEYSHYAHLPFLSPLTVRKYFWSFLPFMLSYS